MVLIVLLTFDLKRVTKATKTRIAAFHAVVTKDNCFLIANVEANNFVPTLIVRRGIAAFIFMPVTKNFLFTLGSESKS